MTRDEAVTIINRRLGFRRGTDLNAFIVEALKEAQTSLEGGASLPWFLLQEDQTVPLLADTQAYSYDADFLREENDFNPFLITDSDGKEYIIDTIAYDDAKGLYEIDEEGRPEVFARRNSQLYFFPTPDLAYTFKWSYYKKDAVLVSDVENEWLKHAPYLLIARAGSIVASELRDESAMGIFSAMDARWQDWFIRRMTEQREAHVRYEVGKFA